MKKKMLRQLMALFCTLFLGSNLLAADNSIKDLLFEEEFEGAIQVFQIIYDITVGENRTVGRMGIVLGNTGISKSKPNGLEIRLLPKETQMYEKGEALILECTVIEENEKGEIMQSGCKVAILLQSDTPATLTLSGDKDILIKMNVKRFYMDEQDIEELQSKDGDCCENWCDCNNWLKCCNVVECCCTYPQYICCTP